MKHKIGVISDTHGLLRTEVLEKLKGCEYILHGGDINRQSILDQLNLIAPVYAVRGNNDKEWAESLPGKLNLDLFGVKIFMVHNKKQVPEDLSGIDAVISGHSHKYEEKRVGDQLWLNPGSCGPRRFTQPITIAILYIEESGYIEVERCEIEHKKPAPEEKIKPGDLRRIIETVIKDINKGKSVKELAKKNGISEEVAEQICRLYLTHPGVDAEGIMRKMGL